MNSLADLVLLSPDGKPLPRDRWKVVYADSEEVKENDGNAEHVLGGHEFSFWITERSARTSGHPHYLVIDLGSEQPVAGPRCLPRPDAPDGRIKNSRVYLRSEPLPGLKAPS